MFYNLSNILNHYSVTDWLRDITLIQLKSYWSWIRKTPKRENYFASIINLRCAQAHVIYEVVLKMTYPKAIGSKSGRIYGRETYVHSAKQQINILRRVTPQRPVRSKRSRFFCNTWQRIQEWCSQGWKFFCRYPFCLAFLWKTENLTSNCRSSKYVAYKEIRTGPTEYPDFIKGEMHQLTTWNWRADWCSQRRSGFSTVNHIQAVKGERHDEQKIGIPRKAQNSKELSATKSSPKKTFPTRQTHEYLAELTG